MPIFILFVVRFSLFSNFHYISYLLSFLFCDFSQQYYALNMGRDNTVNVETTREQIS
jgi:hypothetical protein